MTPDPFAEAARARIDAEADAKRLVGKAMRDAWTDHGEYALLPEALAPRIVEWARTHLAAQDVAAVRALVHYATCRHVGDDAEAAQEPTDAEQAARFAVESKHHLHGTQCLCGFESHRARSRTEHIMTHYFDELSAARAALSAARAARRDEEAR